MPVSYELLDAVNLKDVRTTADVAARLKVDDKEAAKQLRDAEQEGLMHEDVDLSASLPDDQRQFWMLTPEGRAVWDRLDEQRTKTL